MPIFRAGDVVLVSFPFEDNLHKAKLRPAVVIANSHKNLEIAILKVTTQPPRSKSDYVILEWESAGLLKPSTVRVSKRIVVNTAAIVQTIGRLTAKDLNNVLAIYKNNNNYYLR
ncbi:MAG: type II toxin-antitoxin system PemK/MazF family toxin [Defluviitaleaceae bacterium]|nr:type II toxin-antitoxin system PemK/MazF family toxin [Defluviitaleaceae bacterium]